MPRTIPAALVPIVEAVENSPVELYEITLDRQTLRFAVSDQDVTFPSSGGDVYTALSIERSPISTHLSEQRDELKIGLDNVNQELSKLLTGAKFRGRTCRIIKVFREALGDAANFIEIFSGQMDQPTISPDMTFRLRVRSRLDLVNKNYPLRIFSSKCNYKHYDPDSCTVDRLAAANFKNGVVLAGTTKTLIIAAVLTDADDYWIVGRIKFTTGVNIDESRLVTGNISADTSLRVRVGFPSVPDVGDTFLVERGCDLTPVDCKDKFSNYANYGGFDHIPKPIIPLSPVPGGGGKGGGK